MIPAKIYPLTIPANGSFVLPVYGTMFKVLSASSTFTVHCDTVGLIGALQPGQGIRQDAKEPPFRALTFNDTSGAANNLTVLVADDTFIDDRVTGDVSVIDGNKAKSIANAAYVIFGSQPGVAGQFSYQQLWNPAGSGRFLVIDRIVYSSSTSTVNYIRLGGAAGPLIAAAGTANSKLAGSGAANVSEYRGGSAAGLGGNGVQLLVGSVNQSVIYQPPKPVVVPPGTGASVWTGAVNQDVTVNFEWTEELIP